MFTVKSQKYKHPWENHHLTFLDLWGGLYTFFGCHGDETHCTHFRKMDLWVFHCLGTYMLPLAFNFLGRCFYFQIYAQWSIIPDRFCYICYYDLLKSPWPWPLNHLDPQTTLTLTLNPPWPSNHLDIDP